MAETVVDLRKDFCQRALEEDEGREGHPESSQDGK